MGIGGNKLLGETGTREGEGVCLYCNDHLESVELHLGVDKELTESLCIRVKGRAGEGDSGCLLQVA